MTRSLEAKIKSLIGCKEGELQLWIDALVENRSELVQHLQSLNMHCRAFWFPLHIEKPYKLLDSSFPNSTRLAPKAVWLPSAFTMSEEDVTSVCNSIREFYANRG